MDTLFIIVVLLVLGAVFYFLWKKRNQNSMDVIQDASPEEATIVSDFEETTPSETVVDESLEDVLNEPVNTVPTEENRNV